MWQQVLVALLTYTQFRILVGVIQQLVSVVLALLIANKHTSSIKVTVLISSDTDNDGASANADVNVIKDVHLDDGTSLEMMSGQKYVLQATDSLKIYADNANLDVTLSFMEITT